MTAPSVAPNKHTAPGYEEALESVSARASNMIVERPHFTVHGVAHNGEELILRRVKDDEPFAKELFARRLEALRRGVGSAILEQVVAYDDTHSLTRRARGVAEAELSTRQVRAINRRQCGALLGGYVDAAARGTVPDVSRWNTYYHPRDGFTEIDYDAAAVPSTNPVSDGQHHYIGKLGNWLYYADASHDRSHRRAWCDAYNSGRAALLEAYPPDTMNDENRSLLEYYDGMAAEIRQT